LESIRPAGDVNGDGLADALLSARNTRRLLNGSWTRVGAAGVLLGRREGYPAHVGFSELDQIFYGGQAGQLGHPAMDRGADFDRDGRADVLINDPYYLEPIGGDTQLRGRLWLIRSTPPLPKLVDVEASASRYFVADTRLPGMFGYTWTTGDWNADGRPDIVVGDHYRGDSELHDHSGVAYLFYNGGAFRP
jgi:hypothetical protein